MVALLPALFLAVSGSAAFLPARATAADEAVPTGAQELNADTYRQADALFLARGRAGAPEEARALLEAKLAVSPLDVGLLWRYGRARIVTGERSRGWGRGEDFLAAEQYLRSALDIEPENAEAGYWLGLALFRRGRYRDALRLVDASLKRAPNDARLRHLAGDICWTAPAPFGGDKARAVIEFERALELSDKFADHYVSLAEAYSDLGRLEEASAVLARLDHLTADADPAETSADSGRIARLRQTLARDK